jgi:Protein of unknown function (DUF2656)
MLLSHNFDLSGDRLPRLSRTEFADLFIEDLTDHTVQCRLVDHPHWIVEVRFASAQISPQQVGELCAQILLQKRKTQQPDAAHLPEILILGGLKSTPATSDAPDALQPGEWGVDVVETANAEQFLQGIQWAETVAGRSPDTIFKVKISSVSSNRQVV